MEYINSCTCPKCHKGILEPLWKMSLNEDTKQIETSLYDYIDANTNTGVVMVVCSRDICGHTEFQATKNFFYETKQQIKAKKASRYLHI